MKYIKKIVILIVIIIPTIKLYSQTAIKDFLKLVDAIYGSIDSELVPTNILFDQGFRNIDNLIIWEQTQSDYYNYWAIYNNLQRCKHRNSEKKILPEFDSLIHSGNYKNNIPLSYIFYKGNYLGANETLKLFENKDYLPIISETKIFALSAMTTSIYNSNVMFELKNELVFSNDNSNINKLEIDFGDGNGFRDININSDNINVNYKCVGEKSIVAKLYTDNDTLIANSKIKVERISVQNENMSKMLNSTASLKSSGTIEYGNYEYHLGDDNVLDKPILIVEGFDLLNNYSAGKLYSDWKDALSHLQAEGYDVFCLNFNDAKRSMHSNKEVVKAMINKINEEKTGNFEGVIIGESMGGILCRMALKEMENEGIDHQMGLYVSFDSPHKGANVPPGIQTGAIDALDVGINDFILPFFDIYGAIFGNIASSLALKASLNSVAAKQLLSRHVDSPLDFYFMQIYLSNLGYPNKTRNVALINGNNQGKNLPFSLGDRIFNHQLKWTALLGHYHELTLNSTKINTLQQLVSQITIISVVIPDLKWYNFLGIPPMPKIIAENKFGYYNSDSKAYDNCPGGTIDISNLKFIGLNLNCDIDEFCFVPTSSSIDLDYSVFNTSNGLNYLNKNNTKDDIINSNKTPFDDIYATKENTGHVYMKNHTIQSCIKNMTHQEIMHDTLYIQNRRFDRNRDFEATHIIELGNDVDKQAGKNIKTGNVVVKAGSKLTLSAPTIILKPGTTIKSGCNFRAKAIATSTTLKNTKESDLSKPKSISFLPLVAQKKIKGKNCYYIKNISENDITSVSWNIFANNFNYNTTTTELQLPSNMPNGQYTLKIELQTTKGASMPITKVLNISSANNFAKKQTKHIAYDSITIEAYPNPTNGILYLKQNGYSNKNFTAVIFDLKGNKLIEKKFYNSGFIDMTKHKGFFLLTIKQNRKTITRKIISH